MEMLQRVDAAVEAYKAQHAGVPPGVLFLGLKELGEFCEFLSAGKPPPADLNEYTLVAAINYQGMSVQAVLTETLVDVR